MKRKAPEPVVAIPEAWVPFVRNRIRVPVPDIHATQDAIERLWAASRMHAGKIEVCASDLHRVLDLLRWLGEQAGGPR